jgi:prepilin-type N-terminal cleavage/methylation domain-containing protein
MKKQHGFTLIELLVVIAIIAILASVIIASLNSTRVKSRNARRSTDVKSLVTAFQLGLNGSTSFPDSGSAGGGYVCVSSSCTQGWSGYVASSTVDAVLLAGISQKPTDPIDGTRGYSGYLYNSNYSGSPIINWLAEPPVSGNICAPGVISSSTANYVSCIVYLK